VTDESGPAGAPARAATSEGYRIGIMRAATKVLEKIPQAIRSAISEKIDGFVSNPRPHGCEKLTDWKPPTWRARVGDYRILYSIDDDAHTAIVRSIENRADAYK
jgi:mRNA interferase RelE/StbE